MAYSVFQTMVCYTFAIPMCNYHQIRYRIICLVCHICESPQFGNFAMLSWLLIFKILWYFNCYTCGLFWWLWVQIFLARFSWCVWKVILLNLTKRTMDDWKFLHLVEIDWFIQFDISLFTLDNFVPAKTKSNVGKNDVLFSRLWQ